MRIPPPNYTQLPNVILDNMAEMGNAELRIIMAIARKTFGWQKTTDRISLSQLCDLTGLSRQGVLDGIAKAIENGWVEKTECGNSFEYSLIVKPVDQPEPEMVKPVDHLLVKPVDTQKKQLNKKEKPLRENPPRERTPLQKELSAIQSLFATTAHIEEPTPKSKKETLAAAELWYQPIRRIQAACNGTSLRIVELAVKKMRADGLTVSSPKSIEKVCISLHADFVDSQDKPAELKYV